jgi:hypothetical protein
LRNLEICSEFGRLELDIRLGSPDSAGSPFGANHSDE